MNREGWMNPQEPGKNKIPLLCKCGDIEVPDNSPFSQDKLEREKYVESLTRLIQTLEQPFVLSINGGWGTGKTTFVEMWHKYLHSQGHFCLFFNAWENDFADDPLAAIIAEIGETIESRKELKEEAKTILRGLKKAGVPLIKNVIPIIVRAVLRKVADDKATGEIRDIVEQNGIDATYVALPDKDPIKDYRDQKRFVKKFKDELGNFVNVVSGIQSNEVKPPVVFFIDELDRCRPTYAVELLERIKHLFNVPGILFVLSLNFDQLAHSIRSLYGEKIDAEEYLRRFFDLQVNLPEYDPVRYINYLWEKYNLQQVVIRGNNYKENIASVLGLCRHIFNMSIRDLQQIFTEINVALRVTPKTSLFPAEIIVFLFCLRAYEPEMFKKFVDGDLDAEELLKWINNKYGKRFMEMGFGVKLEFFIQFFSKSSKDFEALNNIWGSHETSRNLDLQNTYERFRDFYTKFTPETFKKYVLEIIELTRNIN